MGVDAPSRALPTTRLRKKLSASPHSLFRSQDCRDEALGLRQALSRANSRLARLDALEADARARAKQLGELQEERRGCDESLAKERDRTQHLVRTDFEIDRRGRTQHLVR